MTFLGYTDGTKGYKFMRKPNNIIFHAMAALFDEYMFPQCPDNKSPGHTCIGREYPSELNIPPEDGDWFDGGAYPPNMPYIPAGNIPPAVPQGPQVLHSHLYPSSSLFRHRRHLRAPHNHQSNLLGITNTLLGSVNYGLIIGTN